MYNYGYNCYTPCVQQNGGGCGAVHGALCGGAPQPVRGKRVQRHDGDDGSRR